MVDPRRPTGPSNSDVDHDDGVSRDEMSADDLAQSETDGQDADNQDTEDLSADDTMVVDAVEAEAAAGLVTVSERELDWALVQRAQQGEARAFALLMQKYKRKLGRLVSRLVKNPDDIDDVVQDSFIKAYRALGDFRGESAFYTWMYRIAINTAKNFLVAASRRPTAHQSGRDQDDDETFQPLDYLSDQSTPESELLTRQIANTVNEAVAALPEELRTAITLREMEGLSYEEIAEAMACPVGTVRSRIFRAREAIATRLRPLLGTSGQKRW